MFPGKTKNVVSAMNDYIKEVDMRIKSFEENHKIINDKMNDLENSFGSQINELKSTLEELNEKFTVQEKTSQEKVTELSKSMEEISGGIKEISDEKMNLVTEDIKALNKELFQSKNQLGILKMDVKDIASVNKSIAVLRARMDTLDDDKAAFESRLQDQESNLRKGTGDINQQVIDLKEELMKTKKQLVDVLGLKSDFDSLKFTVDQMKSTLKEEVISERDEHIANLSQTIRQLEASRNTISKELAEVRAERDRIQNRLIEVEREFSSFKTKSEPDLIKNTHIRTVLRQTEMGKILLELMKVSPNTIKLETLSDRVGVASVIVKTAVNAMHDMRLVRYEPGSREVRLL
ncbi:MAG: hypothetical protein ACFFD4_16670 [Candidatus Odinarchaeota archaeon]